MKPLLSTSLPLRTTARSLHRQYPRPTRHLSTSHPLRSTPKTTANPLRSSTTGNARSREQELAAYRRSMALSAAGIAACAVAMYGVIKLDVFGLEAQQTQQHTQESGEKNNKGAMKMEGPAGFPSGSGSSGPSVIRVQGQDGAEQVATGTSTVPYFPSTIWVPGDEARSARKRGDEVPIASADGGEEYQLLGLGVRTVSFLKIQVYVVGLYVAKSDISELQRRLVDMAVHPPGEERVISNEVGATSATSLVSTERQRLKEVLLDEEKGDDAWNAILKGDGLRTVFRIVPTRNTDFLHLRDGWVRGITGRVQRAIAKAKARAQSEGGAVEEVKAGEFEDESFGTALNDFKSLFGGGQRKHVPKGQTLLLLRNARGELDALFQTDEAKPFQFLGRVTDERIGRLVWLNYLAGKNVSSEDARRSVVDGVMGIVERPVGTLVQKVL